MSEDGGEEKVRPGRWRRRLGIALVVVAALLVVVVVAGVVIWNNRGPSQPSIGDAVKSFRSSSAGKGGETSLQPKPGVYIYDGTGEEKLSFLSTHQSQDGDLPGTVTRESNGCWTFGISFNSFHSQTWRRCQVDHRLVERGNTVDQKFDFGALSQSEHTVVVCDPPLVFWDATLRAGHQQRVRCTGRSKTTKTRMRQRGVLTYVGPTVLTIGGARIQALHFSEVVRISGGQKGSTHEELWIAASNALPLREKHTITVVSSAPAPLNEVTYSEHGAWRLTSMTPRR